MNYVYEALFAQYDLRNKLLNFVTQVLHLLFKKCLLVNNTQTQ